METLTVKELKELISAVNFAPCRSFEEKEAACQLIGKLNRMIQELSE